jgi:hypothetical protein
MRVLTLVCALAVVAGCGGGSDDEPTSERQLRHHGISIAIPEAWDGRVLYTDAAGDGAVLFQVANFALAPNEGFEPPQELPPGEVDPIKAMAGDDLLIMVSTNQGAAPTRTLPLRISEDSFLSPDSPIIPRGHAIAEEAGCIEGRCIRVTVDFAKAPSAVQLERANGVLASLVIRKGQ